MSSGFKPVPVFPICSFTARYCFLSLEKTLSVYESSVVEYLHVSDVVVDGLCILVWVVCEVGSDSDIIVDGEDAICNDPSRHPYFFLDKSPYRLP